MQRPQRLGKFRALGCRSREAQWRQKREDRAARARYETRGARQAVGSLYQLGPVPMSPAPQSVRRQRRNAALLAMAQALFMSVQAMGTSATPLAGYMLLGETEKWLATIPVFLVHLAIMGTTVPASLLMARIGRR